jgi:hypothetical protein
VALARERVNSRGFVKKNAVLVPGDALRRRGLLKLLLQKTHATNRRGLVLILHYHYRNRCCTARVEPQVRDVRTRQAKLENLIGVDGLGHTNARDVNLPRDHSTTGAESTSNGRRQGDRATARRNAAMK